MKANHFRTPEEACVAVGVDFDGTVPECGSNHRLNVSGDPRGKADGNIFTFKDGAGGCVTNFKGERAYWHNSKKATIRSRTRCETPVTSDSRLRELWDKAEPVRSHPYLTKKGIKPHSRMRQTTCKQVKAVFDWAPGGLCDPLLCIPLTDGTGLVSMQFIGANGKKNFLKGHPAAGVYWATGKGQPDKPIGIAEGVATAISVATVNKFPVVAAMFSGNLAAVAKKAREKYPDHDIYILGEVGRGEREAHEAALSIGAKVAFPPFTDEMIQSFKGGKPTDFNDLYSILAETKSEKSILVQGIATDPKQLLVENSNVVNLSFVPPLLFEGEVSFADTLHDCIELLQKFIWMKEEEAIVCSLWAAATWFVDCVVSEDEAVPYLLISSKTPECGKTKLLDVLAKIVRHPIRASHPTSAAIFRVMNRGRPTLLLDEVDRYLGKDEDLALILDSGNKPGGGKVLRSAVNAKGNFTDEVRAYECFGFKAVVGILAEKFYDTVTSRSVAIKLSKKPHTEGKRLKFSKFEEQFDSIRRRFYTLSVKYSREVRKLMDEGEIEFSDELSNRQKEGCEVIWAMLECMAGKETRQKCKEAYTVLCQRMQHLPSNLMLLRHINSLLQNCEKKWIKSADLIQQLNLKPEWSDLSRKKLAEILDDYDVKTKQVWSENNARCYSVTELKLVYSENR